MFIKVDQAYQGGNLVVTEIPIEDVSSELSEYHTGLIANYVRFLNDKNILGDIEVSFPEIKRKFES